MIENLDRPKSAFLLVDAQRVYAGTSPVTVLNLLSTLPAIRSQMPVIHIFMSFGPRQVTSWPPPLLKPRLTAQGIIYPGYLPLISPQAGDWCMRKSRNDAFSNKNLAPFLRQHGVEQVVVGGFYTCACVLATLEGAFKSGFRTKHLGHLSSDGNERIRLSSPAPLL